MLTPSNKNAPGYKITLNGRDITPKLSPLIELEIVEYNGSTADTLSITLADTEGLEFPPLGGELTAAIGWHGDSLQYKGAFTIDEVSHSGSPAVLKLHARSADLVAGLPGKKSRSWQRISLEKLVAHIAADHGLQYKISPRLAAINLVSPQQTNESDLHFLNRFAHVHDAIATVKNGVLLFLKKAEAKTASGVSLPPVVVQQTQGNRWFYRQTERNTFTGVRARWHSKELGAYKYEQAGEDERATLLPGTFDNAEAAYQAAFAELERLQRGQAVLNLYLALGKPEAAPESQLEAKGHHAAISGQAWVITRTSHRISPQGYTTEIEAETRR